MKILPAGIEEQIDRVDRDRSLIIGISAGLTAFWCLYRVFWSIYLSLMFSIVLWGVLGVVAGVAAFGFLSRYAKRP